MVERGPSTLSRFLFNCNQEDNCQGPSGGKGAKHSLSLSFGFGVLGCVVFGCVVFGFGFLVLGLRLLGLGVCGLGVGGLGAPKTEIESI